MNKTFFDFNRIFDDVYCFVLDPSTRSNARFAVKETLQNLPGNLCQSMESIRITPEIPIVKTVDYSTRGLPVFRNGNAGNGTFPAFPSMSRIDSRHHWMNELELGGKFKMILSGFERKLQISGILVLLGVIIELAPLFDQINAASFMMTLLFGAILMCLGLFLFVYSLVA